MTELTPKKFKELSDLMASAPPETAARLLAMFERMKLKGIGAIPSADLIAAMREAGMTSVAGALQNSERLPSFDRLFFEPFEGLFENGPPDQMLPGALPRAGLKEVWLLVAGHFAPDDIVDMEPHVNAAILCGDMDRARALVVKFRSLVLANLDGFTNEAIAKLAKTPDTKATLLRLVPLLIAEMRGREIWAASLGSKAELHEHSLAKLCEQVELLKDRNADAAREFLLLTMTTLPRACEALRVLTRVSGGKDDCMLDAGEFGIIGRRILAIARRAAAVIEEAHVTGKYDGRTLATTVERYNQHAHGLEREAHLAAHGPWHDEMLLIRKKVGDHLALICQRATVNLEKALPLARTQMPGGRWTHEPKLHLTLEHSRLELALEGLAFISASRLFASLAGFVAPREIAARHATGYLDTLREALLKSSRLATKPENLSQWVQATVSMVETFEGIKAAEVFERRASAAAAAA